MYLPVHSLHTRTHTPFSTDCRGGAAQLEWKPIHFLAAEGTVAEMRAFLGEQEEDLQELRATLYKKTHKRDSSTALEIQVSELTSLSPLLRASTQLIRTLHLAPTIFHFSSHLQLSSTSAQPITLSSPFLPSQHRTAHSVGTESRVSAASRPPST